MATKQATKKDLAYYLALPYTYTLMPDPEEPGFAIKINELPGCLSQGETAGEAMTRIREAMEAWLSVALEDGDPIPEPGDEGFSGKFLVRVPKSVHASLTRRAKAEGVSLNLFVASALAKTVASR
jgi:antitoxin HicB